MKRKIEIKNIFLKRLNNKTQAKIYNKNKGNKTNNLSSNSNTSSNISYDPNNKSIKISSTLYFKPRPIYIISNKKKKHNVSINIYRPKRQKQKIRKPLEIETYEVNYHDGNITLTKINTERNSSSAKNINNYKKTIGYYTGHNSLRANSYEFKLYNNSLNIRNFFNYKYEQIKRSYKLDKLNTYNYSNNNTIYSEINSTFDSFLNKHKIMNTLNNNYINNSQRKNRIKKCGYNNDNFEKKEIKLKSSKSTDIIKLCKFLKHLDNKNDKKGTLIKEKEDTGGIITLEKESIEKKRQKK